MQTLLSRNDRISVLYHSLFNYPLTKEELKRWKPGKKFKEYRLKNTRIIKSQKYYLPAGYDYSVDKKIRNVSFSAEKKDIAVKAAGKIALIPTVLFIGITGSLAMDNASNYADIDFIIITKKNTLWTTRAVVYLMACLSGLPFRRYRRKSINNCLCFNLWLDESFLKWPKSNRNMYTAHEFAQIIPLLNKNNIYQRLLKENKWIFGWWPKAFVRAPEGHRLPSNIPSVFFDVFNPLAYYFQRLFMKKKITIETVSINRAVFHPVNLEKIILDKFFNLWLK